MAVSHGVYYGKIASSVSVPADVASGVPFVVGTSPVQQVDGIQAPEGAEEISQTPTYNEDGRQVGCYMRCTLPARPEIRGNRIYLKKAKRGGHKRE